MRSSWSLLLHCYETDYLRTWYYQKLNKPTVFWGFFLTSRWEIRKMRNKENNRIRCHIADHRSSRGQWFCRSCGPEQTEHTVYITLWLVICADPNHNPILASQKLSWSRACTNPETHKDTCSLTSAQLPTSEIHKRFSQVWNVLNN